MPKVPSERVKFCPKCDTTLQWRATRCKACGAKQPAPTGSAQQPGDLARDPRARLTEEPKEGPSSTDAGSAVLAVGIVLGLILLVVGAASKPRSPEATVIGGALLGICIQWLLMRSAFLSALRIHHNERR